MQRLLRGSVTKILPVLVLLAVGVGPVQSAEFVNGNQVNISRDNPTEGSLFAAVRQLTVETPVEGDLYCTARTVYVEAPVRGDVLCAAQQVTVSGTVAGSVRVLGQGLHLRSLRSGSLFFLGRSLRIGEESRVAGDLLFAGSDATVDGSVSRDLLAAGQSVAVNGPVGGGAWVSSNNLTFGPATSVGGDLTYWSKNRIEADTSVVSGSIHHYQSESSPEPEAAEPESTGGFVTWGFLYYTVALLLVALSLWLPWKGWVRKRAVYLVQHPLPALSWGLVALFVPPPLIVVLGVTLIGLPLSLMIGLAWTFMIILAPALSGAALGRYFLQQTWIEKSGSWWSLVVGIPLLVLLTYAPWLGWLLTLLAIVAGAGTFFRAVLPR